MKREFFCYKRVERGLERETEGGNLIKACHIHVWKYHNETPLYNLYMLIIKSLKKTLKVSQFSRTCQLFNENL
jgi:hypothetical protein